MSIPRNTHRHFSVFDIGFSSVKISNKLAYLWDVCRFLDMQNHVHCMVSGSLQAFSAYETINDRGISCYSSCCSEWSSTWTVIRVLLSCPHLAVLRSLFGDCLPSPSKSNKPRTSRWVPYGVFCRQYAYASHDQFRIFSIFCGGHFLPEAGRSHFCERDNWSDGCSP